METIKIGIDWEKNYNGKFLEIYWWVLDEVMTYKSHIQNIATKIS